MQSYLEADTNLSTGSREIFPIDFQYLCVSCKLEFAMNLLCLNSWGSFNSHASPREFNPLVKKFWQEYSGSGSLVKNFWQGYSGLSSLVKNFWQGYSGLGSLVKNFWQGYSGSGSLGSDQWPLARAFLLTAQALWFSGLFQTGPHCRRYQHRTA